MTNHFILDYETIGQDVFQVPVVNCSYFVFDWDRFTSDNPYTFAELVSDIQFAKFDIKKQIDQDGCVFKKRDLQWWKDQGPIAEAQIKPLPTDITTVEFISDLTAYLTGKKIDRWWSRSNTFDPILLHRQFRDHSTREQLDFLLPYWKVRDIRTYIDTQFNFQNKVNGFCPIDDEKEWNRIFVKHSSVHDVAADVLRLQRIHRTINLD